MSARLAPGDEITIRRQWGTTKAVVFEALIRANKRKMIRLAYRAQVYWPPGAGRYEIELEQGRLMRTPTKPFDPAWLVDETMLATLVAMAEADAVSKRERARAKQL